MSLIHAPNLGRSMKVTASSYRATYVIRDEETAMLVVDPMRRTILNLLAEKAMTQSQIADVVGLTEASIGHHIRVLEKARLVKIVKREEEVHGIMQSFYRSIALLIVVDVEKMPRSVSKYFFPINIERIRGVLATLQVLGSDDKGRKVNVGRIEVNELEDLAEELAIYIAKEADKFSRKNITRTRESVTIEIYGRAIMRIRTRFLEKTTAKRSTLL